MLSMVTFILKIIIPEKLQNTQNYNYAIIIQLTIYI